MKISRNSPCPCGSGKKYKKCCLLKADVSLDLQWRRLCQAHDRLIDRLMQFAFDQFGQSALTEALDEFFLWPDEGFDDAKAELHEQLFFSWFLFNWIMYPADMDSDLNVPAEKTIAEIYASRHPNYLDPLEQRLITAAAGQPHSFYEVLECEPGRGFRLRDVLSGNTADVLEESGSKNARIGDILFGRIAQVDQVAMLVGCGTILIPPGQKPNLIHFRNWLGKANPQVDTINLIEYENEIRELFFRIFEGVMRRPELQNTDGDPLCFHTLHFDIDSAEIAFDRLSSLAVTESAEVLRAEAELDDTGQIARVTIPWSRRGHKKSKGLDNTILGNIEIERKRIKVTVNSSRRAQIIRQKIERRLGKHVNYRTMEIQSLESMLDRAEQPGIASADRQDGQNDLMRHPQVRKQMEQMIHAHWQGWIDQKIPALGGQTPRKAVKTVDGRESIEALLLEAERHAYNDDQAGNIQLDAINVVRRNLGLDKPPTEPKEKPVRSKSSPRIASIKNRIKAFGQAKLDRAHTDFALKLCDKIARMRKLNIMRGREEIWAASIVQVIARVNFLFDPQNELSIEADDLRHFFGTKKSTVGNKASQIQKVCGIHIGHPEFSTPKITNMFRFYETEDGFLISEALLDNPERAGQYHETDPKSWVEKDSDPNRRGKKKRRRKTKKNDNDHQLKLFDDD